MTFSVQAISEGFDQVLSLIYFFSSKYIKI